MAPLGGDEAALRKQQVRVETILYTSVTTCSSLYIRRQATLVLFAPLSRPSLHK